MIMRGRRIFKGRARGKALVCPTPLSFLGGVNAVTGEILDPDCGVSGRGVGGTVLCFPFGRGSTVGSYAMYQLKLNEKAPVAVVNRSAEPIVATGAIIAEIPMIDGIDVSLIADDDSVAVNASAGVLELEGVAERHVVTSILRNRGKILLLHRSNDVGSYQGQWAGVSGYIEKDESAIEAARRETAEEVGLKIENPTGDSAPMSFRSGDTVWTVHPFLFDVPSRRISTDWEHDEHRWLSPDDISSLNTVPGLGKVVRRLLGGPSP